MFLFALCFCSVIFHRSASSQPKLSISMWTYIYFSMWTYIYFSEVGRKLLVVDQNLLQEKFNSSKQMVHRSLNMANSKFLREAVIGQATRLYQ